MNESKKKEEKERGEELFANDTKTSEFLKKQNLIDDTFVEEHFGSKIIAVSID